jgi:pyridoxal phosphate enzyme (YggS family)
MDALHNSIRNNIEGVLQKVHSVSVACGRDPQSIKLIVVTKGQPCEKIEAAILAGAKYFGENYPEETQGKIFELKESSKIEWHMIGHLQTRKSKIVAEHFSMLHSLDSVHLAEKINSQLLNRQKVMPVLLECNISGEESKSGFPAWREDHWPILLFELDKIRALSNLKIQGLMTMPPIFQSPQQVKPYFIRLRKLQAYLSLQFPKEQWDELSMGTSEDYDVAVQEGATFIRIGQAIFGPRKSHML